MKINYTMQIKVIYFRKSFFTRESGFKPTCVSQK